MPAPQIQVDRHGFPIPASFENSPGASSSAKRSRRGKRFFLAVLILSLIGFGVYEFVDSGALDRLKQAWADQKFRQARHDFFCDKMPEALESFDAAAKLDPTNAEIGRFRAAALEEMNRLNDSLAEYDRVLALDADDMNAIQGKANVLLRQGRHDEALAYMDRVIELTRGENGVVLNNRAYYRAVAHKKLEEALADVQLALEKDPDSANALDTRGYVLHLLGRNAEASIDLTRAIESIDADWKNASRDIQHRQESEFWPYFSRQFQESLSVVHHHRGLVQAALGMEREAARDFEQARKYGYNPDKGVF